MSSIYYSNSPMTFDGMVRSRIAEDLLENDPIHTGEWQSMNTGVSPAHATRELTDVEVVCDMPKALMGQHSYAVESLKRYFKPDFPWAETHFGERVSGQPLNPAPSHINWPYAVRGNSDHTDAGKFDHTYPERYWPRHAGDNYDLIDPTVPIEPHYGIRFTYGDLNDVVSLLAEHPATRQAYLPVWFPEDTGGHGRAAGRRVPCTLGYHFMIRDGRLSTRYYMRSCDVYRHFTNDMYLTARLALWIVGRLNDNMQRALDYPPVSLGTVRAYIASMHSFVGDDSRVRDMVTG